MTSVAAAGVREGDILAGKYRVDGILGVGGMGVVVAAHHLRLDERVAIKFLLPDMMLSGEAVARFEREARAAVKIKSEHVARVSDVGTLDNGAPSMVMEYLEGGDLSAWLKQRGPLSFEQAADFVLQACEAIAEAHVLGIIHRDLKPANLFVIRRPDGALSVKVLDFGISKMRGMSGSVPDVSMTKTSAMMGSPLYMSPEQMQSAKDVDSRTDIWALGIILYELVTGASPFLAETMPELVAKILSTPPPPLAKARPDAPPGFEAMLLRCIDRDRERRYESVGQLAADLVTFAPRRSRVSLERISGVMRSAGLSATALAAPPSSDPSEPARGGTQAAWGRTNAPKGRATLTIVASLALLLGATGYFFLKRPTTPTPREPASAAVVQSPAPPPPSPAPLVTTAIPAGPPAAATTTSTPSPRTAADAPSPAQPSPPPAPSKVTRTKTASTKTAAPALAKPPEPPPPSSPPLAVAPKPAPVRKGPGAFDDRK